MSSIKRQKEIISLLAENKEATANLYRLYSEKFPHYRDFWLQLVKETQEQADLIRTLFLYSKRQENVFIRTEIFNIDGIKWVIKYTNNLINEAKSRKYGMEKALSLALDIESSLMGKNLFRVFQGEDRKLQDTLKYLEEKSESRLQRISSLHDQIKDL
ncbi:MAG: hypothetical protein KAS39_07245 [Actinomycetia bacterium]|nr:hypothetical protein [Actinomycetes bacterium]